jgi:hypothetical protein
VLEKSICIEQTQWSLRTCDIYVYLRPMSVANSVEAVFIVDVAYCVTPSPEFHLAYGFSEIQESFIDINVMFL